MVPLDNIRIVMINTSDSGNIGAAARAMKTMGIKHLYLVEPKEYPTAKASARASGAADVLHGAIVTETLDKAIEGCGLVWGTSARLRTIPWPVVDPRQAAEKVARERDDSQIAIVFGREDAGLTNDELHKCHYHISIPSNTEYGVLNVASAVQLICYELRMRLIEQKTVEINSSLQMPLSITEWDVPLVGMDDMDRFFKHFEETMQEIGFFDPENPRQLMTRAKRLFSRTRLDRLEMNLMRGFFSKIQQIKKLNTGN